MISAVIIAKNEEKNIGACIDSLRWCDEIIVIDDNSTDNTKKIAEAKKVKVCTHSLDDSFSSQRNFALSITKNEWVLFVDADERISESLAYEITTAITHNTEGYVGWYIPRVDILFGKKIMHGDNYVVLVRLGKKNNGKWFGKVHETWKLEGTIGLFNNTIYHYPHQTIGEMVSEINYYSTLRAMELYEKKIYVNFFSLLCYPFGKFLFLYGIKRGILDGQVGLIVALLMSFHSFLVRGKLFLLWEKRR